MDFILLFATLNKDVSSINYTTTTTTPTNPIPLGSVWVLSVNYDEPLQLIHHQVLYIYI